MKQETGEVGGGGERERGVVKMERERWGERVLEMERDESMREKERQAARARERGGGVKK